MQEDMAARAVRTVAGRSCKDSSHLDRIEGALEHRIGRSRLGLLAAAVAQLVGYLDIEIGHHMVDRSVVDIAADFAGEAGADSSVAGRVAGQFRPRKLPNK